MVQIYRVINQTEKIFFHATIVFKEYSLDNYDSNQIKKLKLKPKTSNHQPSQISTNLVTNLYDKNKPMQRDAQCIPQKKKMGKIKTIDFIMFLAFIFNGILKFLIFREFSIEIN